MVTVIGTVCTTVDVVEEEQSKGISDTQVF